MPLILTDKVSLEAALVATEEAYGLQLFDVHKLVTLPELPAYKELDDPRVGSCQLWRMRKADKLKVCLTVAREEDARVWLHVSYSFKNKMPSYQDMCHVKAVFVGPDLPAYMIMPRTRDHYNLHQHCLHWFAPLEGRDPLPDFALSGGI